MTAVFPDTLLAAAMRHVAVLSAENEVLRSLVELMAMRIPVAHMPEAERALLTEILDNA